MILDASALIAGIGDSRAEAGLRGGDVAAPDLIVPEVLNAFWKLARRGIPVPDRATVLGLLDKIRVVPSLPYAARAAEIADEFDHPVYDCLYLALAEAQGDVLLTADARLSRKLGKTRLRKRIRPVAG